MDGENTNYEAEIEIEAWMVKIQTMNSQQPITAQL